MRRLGGLWGFICPSFRTNATLPWNPSSLLRYASLCIFSLTHVAGTILNKDNDLSPLNIYKISKGINFIDFYPLAHIWSSHCWQRLKDLYLALFLADLSVETENPSAHMDLQLESSAFKSTAGGMEDEGQWWGRRGEGCWRDEGCWRGEGCWWWQDHPVQSHLGCPHL